MSTIIQFGQSEDMYGKNESTLKVLSDISVIKTEMVIDLNNFINAIEKFNLMGIEVDISIKFDNIIFKEGF